MQRCVDCGHPNRPGVRFCTHCGKPEPASGATAKGPTTIVAVVVLAVGLLAFLSIRPIAPRQAVTTASSAPAQIVEPLDAAAVARVESSDAADALVAAPTAVTEESLASIDAVSSVDALIPSAELAQPSPAADPAEPPSATSTAALVEAPATFDSPMLASSPGSEVLGSGELVLPAAAPLAMPAAPPPLAPRQHVAGPPLHRDAASRPHVPAPPASPPHSESPPVSSALSSPARHAAVDAAPARRIASRPSRQPVGWLNQLRAEMAACEGDFLARTICRETAKHQHCESANAWGTVPECPAARLPDFANFN